MLVCVPQGQSLLGLLLRITSSVPRPVPLDYLIGSAANLDVKPELLIVHCDKLKGTTHNFKRDQPAKWLMERGQYPTGRYWSLLPQKGPCAGSKRDQRGGTCGPECRWSRL